MQASFWIVFIQENFRWAVPAHSSMSTKYLNEMRFVKQVLKVSAVFLKQLFGGCIRQALSESRPGSFPGLLCNPSWG